MFSCGVEAFPPPHRLIFCINQFPCLDIFGINRIYRNCSTKKHVFFNFASKCFIEDIYIPRTRMTYLFLKVNLSKTRPKLHQSKQRAPPFGYSRYLHPTLRGAWSQCLHFWSFQQNLFTSSALMTQLQRQMRWEMALIHLEGGNFEDHRASHATIMALKVSFFGGDVGEEPTWLSLSREESEIIQDVILLA